MAWLRVLADAVVLLHFVFIIYGLLGGFLYFWRRWLVVFHVPLAIWIGLVEINHWICPLTPLENRLRHQASEAGYQGGFIEHYVIPIIYPPGLTPNIQVMLGIAALALNGIIYAVIIRHYIKNKNAVLK